jgi:hypothetical protein
MGKSKVKSQKGSRAKGQNGEREIIGILQPIVDEVYGAHGLDAPKLQRNTLQCDQGGHDLAGLDWISIEVKRCEQLAIEKWWAQTIMQAGKTREPVLFYRRNGERSWHVCMRTLIWISPDRVYEVFSVLMLADAMRWFRARLSYELEKLK